jgi:hypothetical protein
MNHFSVFSLLIWRRVADTVRSNNNPNRFSYLSFLFCTSAVIILGLGQWVEFGVAGLDFFYKKKIREKKKPECDEDAYYQCLFLSPTYIHRNSIW